MNKLHSTAFGNWLEHVIRTRKTPDGKAYLKQQVLADACGITQSHEPIKDIAVLAGGNDQVSRRMIKAVRSLMRDKSKMAVAVAMIEAMLQESENDDAAITHTSRKVPSQAN